MRGLNHWSLRDGLKVFNFETEQEFKEYVASRLPNVDLYFSGSPHGFSDTAYNRNKAA